MAAQGWAGTALPSLSLGTAGIKEWGGEVTVNDQRDGSRLFRKERDGLRCSLTRCRAGALRTRHGGVCTCLPSDSTNLPLGYEITVKIEVASRDCFLRVTRKYQKSRLSLLGGRTDYSHHHLSNCCPLRYADAVWFKKWA